VKIQQTPAMGMGVFYQRRKPLVGTDQWPKIMDEVIILLSSSNSAPTSLQFH
jgi:hypothetical protein